MKCDSLKKLFWLPLMWILLSQAAQADEQGWFNNSLSVKASATVTFKINQETRNNELTMADAYLHNWSGGISWAFSPKFYVGAAYHRETTAKSDYNLQENRYILEAGWKTSFSKKWNFDARLRSEIRIYEDDLAEDHLRLRLRLRLVHTMTIASLIVKPFLAIEPFANMKKGEINSNRIYAGVTLPLSKQIAMRINYIRQDTKDKDTLHILSSGFDLKF